MALKVLVTGITGQQGGAVAEVLRSKGHHVRGLTRNVDSKKAKDLKSKGYEIVHGDMTDRTALEKAAKGVDAIFAMSTFMEAGLDAEVEQGKAVADAAKKSGAFLVYSSVAGADLKTGIPHFDSKYAVEKYIKQIGVAHAIVAPVYFMENLYFPQTKEALDNDTYASPLPPDLKLQEVALADIGQFGALVVENRAKFEGQRIEIASDTVTGRQQAKLLGDALGRKVGYFQVPLEQIKAMSEDFAIMYQWFIDHGYKVDTEGLRKQYPEVKWHNLKSWIETQNLN